MKVLGKLAPLLVLLGIVEETQEPDVFFVQAAAPSSPLRPRKRLIARARRNRLTVLPPWDWSC